MIKIEIYPFLEPSEEHFSCGRQPVDFSAIPLVTDALGWVTGTELLKSYSGHVDVHNGFVPIVNNVTSSCLMAVVEINNEIQEVEYYRVKILKEE